MLRRCWLQLPISSHAPASASDQMAMAVMLVVMSMMVAVAMTAEVLEVEAQPGGVGVGALQMTAQRGRVMAARHSSTPCISNSISISISITARGTSGRVPTRGAVMMMMEATPHHQKVRRI